MSLGALITRIKILINVNTPDADQRADLSFAVIIKILFHLFLPILRCDKRATNSCAFANSYAFASIPRILPMILYPDASDKCIGSCLAQHCPKQERAVECMKEEIFNTAKMASN